MWTHSVVYQLYLDNVARCVIKLLLHISLTERERQRERGRERERERVKLGVFPFILDFNGFGHM